VELWRKTRVVASAVGAAPVGVLLFGVALHRARRRRPEPGWQDDDPTADAYLI
jgi:hypothetical protein